MFQLPTPLLILLSCIPFWCSAQPTRLDLDPVPKSWAVIFYNVENLFDTLDDAYKWDEEFLPQGEKSYGSVRYWLKIRSTARALRMAIAQSQSPPLAIGLAEVENMGVVLDVMKHPAMRLKNCSWETVLFDSPDPRGIDCAIIVNTQIGNIVRADRIRYSHKSLRTRDAPFVEVDTGLDTVRMAVVHLSSKRGGAAKSATKRFYEIQYTLQHLEHLDAERKVPIPTLVLGDFNNGPQSPEYKRAISQGWQAPQWDKGPGGSYKYKGRWSHIDLILTHHCAALNARILDPPDLLEQDTKWGGLKPRRTWQGSFFKNGYSDHLPVCLFVSHNSLKMDTLVTQ